MPVRWGGVLTRFFDFSTIACEPPVKWGTAAIGANSVSEDRFRVLKGFGGSVIAGIFDGHGGWGVSEYLCDELMSSLVTNRLDENRIVKKFEIVDEKLANLVFAKNSKFSLQEGSCALAAVVSDTQLIVASSGDSRALFVDSNGESSWASALHTADCPEEQAKLRSAHPLEKDVVHCRQKIVELDEKGQILTTRWGACYVKGRLQPTRAFGDFYLKDIRSTNVQDHQLLVPLEFTPPYITASPSVTVFPRTPGSTLILASDGLWDYVSGEMAGDLIRSGIAANLTPDQLANSLISSALSVAAESSGMTMEQLLAMPQNQERRNVHDDITVIVLIM